MLKSVEKCQKCYKVSKTVKMYQKALKSVKKCWKVKKMSQGVVKNPTKNSSKIDQKINHFFLIIFYQFFCRCLVDFGAQVGSQIAQQLILKPTSQNCENWALVYTRAPSLKILGVSNP